MSFGLFRKKQNKKPLSDNQEKHVRTIMKATGWSHEEAVDTVKAARSRYGITFYDYARNEFWNVPEQEQPQKYKALLTERVRKKNRYDEMAMKSGLSVEELKKQAGRARKKYGLTLLDFKDNDFWGVPESEQKEVSRRIIEAKTKKANDKVTEKDAAQLREAFIISDDGQPYTASGAENTYPGPVRAACAILGHPLPKGAVMDWKLEEQVGQIECGFNELRSILGDKMLPDTPDMRKEYKRFRKRFSNFGPLKYSDTAMAVLFTDLMFFGFDYGFRTSDYFEYHFYEKEIPERNTFISQGYRGHVRTVCNTNMGLFKNKPKFNEFFDSVLKRDWLQVTAFNFDEFKAFVERNSSFFYKPIRGGGGVKSGIMDTEGKTIEELYKFCSEHECIVEEVLKQHRDMAAFNDGVANTVRVYTLIKADGETEVTGAFVKFSRPGLPADNLLQGGIGALVDKDTGELITDGIDYNCNYHKEHPDSHLPFKGFRIPEWSKLIDTAIEGAKIAKKWNRHAGWDIAIRQDGDIEVIEGNSWPDLSLLQIADCKGKKYVYEKDIHELAMLYGIEDYPEIPENIIAADTDEQCRLIREKVVDTGKSV